MDKKLNEVTKVTDMAYVPVIMADGSIGQIAKSDLASVVAGVLRVKTLINHGSIGNDANDLTTTGDYLVSNVTANIPIEKWGTIKVSGNGLDLSQMFISINGGETFIRSKANGAEFCRWQRIDNFGYNSLEELAGGVAGQIGNGVIYWGKTGQTIDLNNIKEQSTYLIYNTCTNVPSSIGAYGWITTLPSYSNDYGVQLLIDVNGVFYYRVKDVSWGSWKKITAVNA